jgi:molybdopterin-guanine dinucleotide biosynthesis protein A
MQTDLNQTSSPEVTGAILAGGRSLRMGRDKAMIVMPDGRPMIEHVRAAMSPICARVVIVGRADIAQMMDCDSLDDLRPGRGPLGGIEALLASGIDPRGEYLICPCDVPMMSSAILQLLASSRACTVAPATVLRVRGCASFESLPLRIHEVALGTVTEHLDRGVHALWRVLDALRPQVIEIDKSMASGLRNINTPGDLQSTADLPHA